MFIGLLFLFLPGGVQENPAASSPEPFVVQQDRGDLKARKISLKQAILMALQNNLDIEVARFTPLIDKANIEIYEAPFDYMFAGQWEIQDSVSPTELQFAQNTFMLESRSDSFNLGASRMIPYGASFGLNYSLGKSFTEIEGISYKSDKWNQSLGLSVVVPFLKGAGVEYNYTSLLIAQNTEDASVYTFEKTLTETLYGIHQAYWNLVYAVEDRRVKEQSLNVATKLRDEVARKLEHGVVIKLDLTQAEAGVATRQEGILTAKAAVLNAMDQLKRQIDPSLLRGDRLIMPSEAPKDVQKAIDEKKAVLEAFAIALKHRPDYLQLDLQMDSQQLTMNKADRDLLPKLNLTGTAGLLSGSTDDFSDSSSELLDTESRNFGVTLDFEYVLGQSSARGTYNAAQLGKRQLQLSKRNLEDLILLEIREAVRAILTNEKRIEATKKARKLAEEQFQAELNRKKRQVSTTFRVLDVQEDLAQAQANEMKTRIDYQLSLVNLQRVTGTLLDKMGIKLRETLSPRTK